MVRRVYRYANDLIFYTRMGVHIALRSWQSLWSIAGCAFCTVECRMNRLQGRRGKRYQLKLP